MPGNVLLRRRLNTAAHVLNSHRLLVYALVSFTTVAAVVLNALKTYSNFYSVAIYLSKSSRSVLALANFCFLLALFCGHIIQRIFFGPLRPNEVERLYDRLWFFITESLLAFAIFRDEFDASFGFMFGFLLFVKSFHWLAGDRIEWMDQRPYPGPPLLFHLRMVSLFAILWVTDFIMFVFTIEHTISVGVGGMVLFASEYGILIASVMNTISKYLLSAYELRRAGQRGGENAPLWENKSMWTFYIELATDFMKLTVYLVFFTVIITFYGLPLNIVRDVYVTARSFITRLRALHRYQTATRNMDQRYPDATEEELTAMSDQTCIICREEMVLQVHQDQTNGQEGPNMTPKKLPCGHVFHFYCLRSWLERQQSCPTCRRTVLEDSAPANARAANNPPAPAPGPAPQVGNVPAALPNANQQVGNNPLGNPLGFNINRHAGDNVANIAEQQVPPAVLIQYEVHYQGQRPQPANQLPQNLAPVPQFDGHTDPTGVWQPWPLNRDIDQQPSVPPSPAEERPSEQSEDPIKPENDSDSDSDSGSSADELPSTPRLSAREAAREAALRRFGVASSTTSSNLSQPSSSSVPTPTPTTTSPVVQPQSQTLPMSHASTSSVSSEPVNTDSRPSQQGLAPYLIPLYDLVFSADPYTVPSMLRGAPTNSTHSTQAAEQGSVGNRPPLAESRSLASIPSHISDEQLSTLDQLTREAIDERLRVLEGVSNTVYRCIDDLMRMRSALPPLENASTTRREAPESSTSKREGKRPEHSGSPAPSSGKAEDGFELKATDTVDQN